MKTGQVLSCQVLSMCYINYILKPCFPVPGHRRPTVKPPQPRPGALPWAPRPSVHHQGLCSQVQYLESWLTEEVKQIPGARGIDKDTVATVKTTSQITQARTPSTLAVRSATLTRSRTQEPFGSTLLPAEPAPDPRRGVRPLTPCAGHGSARRSQYHTLTSQATLK